MNDIEAMTLAIEEAKLGLGFVSPNPPVGCVILDRDGHLLAKGYHSQLGQNHAEIDALRKIADPKKLEGAKVYVTLEPCSHHGRTPPCADALAKLPIAEVIYGLEDPNPLVSGRGAQVLKDAGKKVRLLPEMRDALYDLAEIFIYNMTQKKTFVTLKVATSLDGKLALNSGESQWITHDAAQLKAHELRGFHDAVMIGVNTLLLDNPRLNVRHPRFVGRPANSVVILDPNGKSFEILAQEPVMQLRDPQKNVFVVVSEGFKKPKDAQAQIVECRKTDVGHFDLKDLASELYKKGICSIYVEGGAETHSEFLHQKVVQRLYQFISPVLLGDVSARTWTQKLNITEMKDRIEIKNPRWEILGPDILVTGTLV